MPLLQKLREKLAERRATKPERARKRADAAGHWRFSAPKKYGGKDGSNLWMAVIRDRLSRAS